MTYRSEARPYAALNRTAFAQSIADTLSQVHQYRPHVFDMAQALDDSIHRTVIFRSQKHAGRLKPLINNI